MFEPFSCGYYLGRLHVRGHGEDHAAIHGERHEQVNRELYADGEGLERLDTPLVMKLETTHFTVHGDDSVPDWTLAVPDGWLSALGVENPPSLREVFLARADRAAQLLELAVTPA